MPWLSPYVIIISEEKMISAIEGVLEAKEGGKVFINVGGIIFQLFVPASAFSQLPQEGSKVRLFTHLQVKEDGLALYGFVSREELELFIKIISVPGLGARQALSLLSALKPEELVWAIVSGDVELLSRFPGVGKKTAEKLVLELRGKLEKLGVAKREEADSQLISALVNLGYSLSHAAEAVASIPRDQKLGWEEKFKLALQYLSSS